MQTPVLIRIEKKALLIECHRSARNGHIQEKMNIPVRVPHAERQ